MKATVIITEHLKRSDAVNYTCNGDERTIGADDLQELAEILTGVENAEPLTAEQICLATIFEEANCDLAAMLNKTYTWES